MTTHNASRLISSSGQIISRDASALVTKVGESFRALRTYWAHRRERSRQLQELYRFSDRELWDVGLSRSDIQAIQKGQYRRD